MTPLAQLAAERLLNSLPEGLLIALGAWLLLRFMGRENSGTRFAVWFVALAGVVALPFFSGLDSARHDLTALVPQAHPAIAIPAFWATAFFMLWVAFATLALARVILGLWQVRQIRHDCTEIPAAELDPEIRALLADTGRPVRLLTSDKARVPAALGFRNPAIVLPTWALADLSTTELRPILIHELAHLHRRDDWTNLLQKIVRALFFFHPAVWWIDARLSIEREMACDDAVLAATGNPRAYAECLIDLLEKGCARRGWSMAQAAVARARDASVRIARILRVGPAVTTRIGRAALGAAASLSLIGAAIALWVPQFVAFVPINSTAHIQSLPRPLPLNDDFTPSHAAVVPATFHPAERSIQPHAAIVKRSRPSHQAPFRQAALVQKHATKPPVVMARLARFEASEQQQPAPTMLIFETTEITTAMPAQLRSINAPPAANTVRRLQSSENPALQIQVLRVIDPATGVPMQILRILLVMPQQPGSPSQAI